MPVIADIGTAFVLGLLTPLSAACVLPLYPGFLSYIAGQLSGRPDSRRVHALIGFVVTTGVILFMLLVGVIFIFLLEKSLDSVIGVISPIAFGILLIVSLLLIFNVDFGRFFPKAKVPLQKNPLISAFLFGFFFGALVIPCNPTFIIALLTRATVSVSGFFSGILSFLAFGFGIGFPLLAFSLISSAKSSVVIGFITARKRWINLVSGIFMLLISLYYLVSVFKVFGNSRIVQIISIPLEFMFSWVGLFVPPI